MAPRKAEREEDYYAGLAAGYDELHREEQERKLRLILQHFRFRKDESLLDVGCGTGFSLGLWPCRATGAEPSKAMIDQAPPRVQARIFHVRAEDLSIFHDGEFDVVASVTALHNFTDPEAGLREIKRVGKRRFILTVLKSGRHDALVALVKRLFPVTKELDDRHDTLLLCNHET